MVYLFIGIEIIGICMIFTAMGLLIPGDGAREQKMMCFFLSGSLVQNVGYLLELTAGSLDAALLATKVQYLGSMFVPLCYCWFVYSYCHRRPPSLLLGCIMVVDLCVLGLVFTLEWHSLYYRSTKWLVTESGHHYLSLEYGLGYPLFLICGCAVPYVLSIYALLRAIHAGTDKAENRNYKLMVFLSGLPVLALLSYAEKLTYVFDLTPAVLGISLSAVVISIWSRRNYDFRHLAAEVVLNSMADGVISLDGKKRLVSYNKAAAGIFKDLSAHTMGESIADMQGFDADMLDENTKKKFRVGERYYESHAKQILDKYGRNQGSVILILDITDTTKYIEEIKRVREQAERANTAKSEFLANMSHEIRTPMNAIIGISDIIAEESREQKMYSYACDIKSAAQSLLAIINGILDLSKVEAGKMELVCSEYYLKAMMGDIIGMMDMAASQHGLVLKYEYDTALPCRYWGDEGRIKQILINILNNAIKFTKEGYVSVTIGGTTGKTEDEEILIFSVEDTGCGIRKEDQEKIFENFKQVDARRNHNVEGTGLGLSITKQLVNLMQGSIAVESVYGEGTTFTVTIPQKIADRRTLEEVPDAPVRKTEVTDAFTAPGCKVLVVDDNLINRKVARGFLKPYQLELTEAASGPESIELVRKKKFDMIFMDHMMPEMDGIEAVQIIRRECGENGSEPVIIALTANAMEGVKEKFLASGFQDFVSKPLDRKAMHDVLLRWIPENRRQHQEARAGQDAAGTGQDAAGIGQDAAGIGQNTADGGQDAADGGLGFEDIHIRGIDMEAVMRYHSGTAADYLEILQMYVLDGKRKLVLLHELLDKKDYETYEIEVHGLKSASANIGAMKLSSLAREQEEAAVRGDTEFIFRHFPDLLSAYEKQMKHIEDFLKDRQGMEMEEKEESPELDRETLLKEAGEALELLKNFHSKECAGKLEELLGHRLDKEEEKKLREIQLQLKMYEDDEAERLLQEFVKGEG